MEKKGQTIFLSVVGIATLLVAIVGATFAWFSTTVTGNASNITITTATLGEISFVDGTAITLDNAYPGAKSSKTFTITADAASTVTAEYEIFLDVTANTLSPVANAAEVKNFVYTLSGTISNQGTAEPKVGGTLVTAIAETGVPVANTSLGKGTIGTKGAVHTYTFGIEFKNTATDQNAAQGKTFNGKLRVVATKQYTAN